MIIIPMVGKSSRFFTAGYMRPKYELEVEGVSVFCHAVSSFRKYFESDFFLFVVRKDFGAENFVRQEIESLGINESRIIVLEHETRGQADTVFQGLQSIIVQESIYIFNIDTFRPGFSKPEISQLCDGYLEVFEGEGDNWSFVEPGSDMKVLRTTEKNRISNLCSDGLYFFRNRIDFEDAFNYAVQTQNLDKGEYYVAPLYNYLIKKGLDIRYVKTDIKDVIFCGTPQEYLQLHGEK